MVLVKGHADLGMKFLSPDLHQVAHRPCEAGWNMKPFLSACRYATAEQQNDQQPTCAWA